jgi:methyltransferase (TIGR00027 family)
MQVVDTAIAIARVRADEGLKPKADRLFEDPYAELFVQGGEDAMGFFEGLPFFREHVRLRTRFIDDSVRAALSTGTRQFVILGAGFDSRGLRLREIGQRHALVFEVDLPEQLAKKKRILSHAGVNPPAHVRTVPADFSFSGFADVLEAALRTEGFAADVVTMFIGEGLLGYLDERAVRELTKFCAGAAAGSRALFTYHQAAWPEQRMTALLLASGLSDVEYSRYADLHRALLGAEPGPGSEGYQIVSARCG